MHNRPRFAFFGRLFAFFGKWRAPQKVAEIPVHLPLPNDTNTTSINFGAGLPRNGAKDWGMSQTCARMVRKNRLHRMGIAHDKI